jgi:hypothetical protein
MLYSETFQTLEEAQVYKKEIDAEPSGRYHADIVQEYGYYIVEVWKD